MQIDILAVGRMKSGPERELYDRYSTRIQKAGKSLHLIGPRLYEVAESRAGNLQTRKDEEAAALIDKVASGSRIVLLEEYGSDVSSTDFSSLLKSEQEAGTQTLAFAIGGPDGHGEGLRERSFRSMRFGKMTWPHQIARVLLVEQLYRSITILSGHPYHRQ